MASARRAKFALPVARPTARPAARDKVSLRGQVAALSVLNSRRTLPSSALRFGLLADFFNALLVVGRIKNRITVPESYAIPSLVQ